MHSSNNNGCCDNNNRCCDNSNSGGSSSAIHERPMGMLASMRGAMSVLKAAISQHVCHVTRIMCCYLKPSTCDSQQAANCSWPAGMQVACDSPKGYGVVQHKCSKSVFQYFNCVRKRPHSPWLAEFLLARAGCPDRSDIWLRCSREAFCRASVMQFCCL